MGRTIIQPIGPLYGEAVNNTVFGRPNGSVYVPETNVITMTRKSDDYAYLKKDASNDFRICVSDGTSAADVIKLVAKSQDNAAFMWYGLYTDEECTTILDVGGQTASKSLTAGLFNTSFGYLFTKPAVTITTGETYYLQAKLFASTGVAVAVGVPIALEAIE